MDNMMLNFVPYNQDEMVYPSMYQPIRRKPYSFVYGFDGLECRGVSRDVHTMIKRDLKCLDDLFVVSKNIQMYGLTDGKNHEIIEPLKTRRYERSDYFSDRWYDFMNTVYDCDLFDVLDRSVKINECRCAKGVLDYELTDKYHIQGVDELWFRNIDDVKNRVMVLDMRDVKRRIL